MKLSDIIVVEAPFDDTEEQQFLAALQQQPRWPSQPRLKQMIRGISPESKELGRGVFSVAYGRRGSDKVIKLSMIGADALATLEYLTWAKEQHNNPHVPVVYSIIEPRSNTKRATYVYARIERLDPLVPKKFPWKQKHAAFIKWMFDNEIGDHPEEIAPDLDYRKLKRNKLVKTLEVIQRTLAYGTLDLSLSSRDPVAHNLMVRPGTDTIVISDPY